VSGNFGLYSQYYDLLYQDKDYAGEVAYVRSLINQYAQGQVARVLELGCGTGVHADLLAKAGIEVHGVELSETMLTTALERAKANRDRLNFESGDARTYRAGRRFDAVLSLFHVLSYQTTTADLEAMMATAATHLNDDGLFIFDFWYGPAVLWQRPSLRVKRWENENVSILRVAEPELHAPQNVVNVNYTIFSTERASGRTEKVEETHSMRFLFLDEIERLLNGAGLSMVKAEEWMTGAQPDMGTWGVCVVARKDKA
jgi:SAM-dependent methyltransferase